MRRVLRQLGRLPLAIVLPPKARRGNGSRLDRLPSRYRVFQVSDRNPIFCGDSICIYYSRFCRIIFAPLPSRVPVSSLSSFSLRGSPNDQSHPKVPIPLQSSSVGCVHRVSGEGEMTFLLFFCAEVPKYNQ